MYDFGRLSATYQEILLAQVVPFWLAYSRDERCGGYFDLLMHTGDPLDADKHVVRQAEQVWSFAYLYNEIDARPAWLEHARHGADFLYQFAHDDRLNCYAVLDRRGRPVAPATDITPDCAVAMAYAQLHRATGADEWAMLAKQTLTAALQRRADSRREADELSTFRVVRRLREPVSLLKTVLEMQPLLDEEAGQALLTDVLAELNEFVDKRQDLLREYILPGGAFFNVPQGRRISPTLIFEAAGYLLDAANRSRQRKLAMQAVAWAIRLCDWAWDDTAGGFPQWLDQKQVPSAFPDATNRLVSTHLEALATLAKGYLYTHHPDAPRWLKKIHEYSLRVFPDNAPQHHTTGRSWQLLVTPDGQALTPLRASADSSCYPFVRCLSDAWRLLDQCAQLQPTARPTQLFRP